MTVAEAPSNWLSKVIAEKRQEIVRLLPFRERRAERDAIVSAIKSHPKGASLANKPELGEVVWAAKGLANHLEREAEKKPIMTASPAIQASWFVFDELGVDRPEPEFD